MRQLITAKLEQKDRHSKFLRDSDGKKVEIPDDGIVYAYIDNHGILHASKYADIASTYGGGKFVMTDEITSIHGKPAVNGKAYSVYGAGEDYVYLSNEKDEDAKYHVKDFETDKKLIKYNKSSLVKKAELEVLRQIYLELV